MNLEKGSDLSSMYQPGGLLKLPCGGRGGELSLKGNITCPKTQRKEKCNTQSWKEITEEDQDMGYLIERSHVLTQHKVRNSVQCFLCELLHLMHGEGHSFPTELLWRSNKPATFWQERKFSPTTISFKEETTFVWRKQKSLKSYLAAQKSRRSDFLGGDSRSSGAHPRSSRNTSKAMSINGDVKSERLWTI